MKTLNLNITRPSHIFSSHFVVLVRQAVAKPVKKANLPIKTCAECGRPFTWRKKWAMVWSDVRYCSDRCRKTRPAAKGVTS
jgi:hypothetical protein